MKRFKYLFMWRSAETIENRRLKLWFEEEFYKHDFKKAFRILRHLEHL